MAHALKLVHLGSDDINLVNASGWYLTDPGWVPQVGEEDGMAVEEALRIQSNFTSQDNLAAALVALNKMRGYAAKYIRNTQEGTAVWLYDQLTSETGARQALVRQMAVKPLAEQHGVGESDTGSMISADAAYELGIVREPGWERTTAVSMPAATPAAAASLSYDYTASPGADVTGDMPARIGYLTISSDTTYRDPVGKLWIGIRSARKHGTLANFANIWECESGDNGTDTGDAADATASGNSKKRVTPGTTTWLERVTMDMGDYTGNWSDNLGMYLWLIRAKLTQAGDVWEIQLRFGYSLMVDSGFIKGPKVRCTSTSWNYLAGGVASIPLVDRRALYIATALGDFQIQIWAQRVSGTGSLDLDCLCPIPIDEGFVISDGFSLQGTVGYNDQWMFGMAPFGRPAALAGLGGLTISAMPRLTAHDFVLPPGDGRMIIVHQQASAADVTDRVLINASNEGYYYPRWLALRGSE